MIRRPHLILLLVLLALTLVASVFKASLILVLLLSALVVWGLSFRVDMAWYILVFFTPMYHWFFYLDTIRPIVEVIPQLRGTNAPIADFWAIIALSSFALAKLRAWFYGEQIKLYLPGIGWFLLFILSALISLTSLHSTEVAGALKYLIRNSIFVYIAYLVLGVNLMKEKKMWERSILVYMVVGMGALLMGLLSLVLGVWQYGHFYRVVPFALGSFAPFGDQHIFLSEIYLVLLPLFLYVAALAKTHQQKLGAYVGALLTAITLVLTLSRASWIVLAVSSVFFVMITRDMISWKTWLRRFWYLLSVPLLFVAYFVIFLVSSPVVMSSNSARFSLLELAWRFFLEHPLVGIGVGQFVTRISEIQVFQIEFGDAIDAHSWVHKIAAEQGLFGLVAFVGFWLSFLLILYRRYRHETDSLRQTTFLLCIFLLLQPWLFQVFSTLYYSGKMWLPLAMALAPLIFFPVPGHATKSPNLREQKRRIEVRDIPT